MNTKEAIKNVATIPNKFNISGGNITGDITVPNDTYLMWARNTDHAKISFKNTSDSDTDSYMHFVTGDNGNEYFKFSSVNGSTTTDWLTIKSDHLRFKGNSVYHTANKPSASDIGALSTSGGTVNGAITSTVLNVTNENGYKHSKLGITNNHVIGVAPGIIYLGNPEAKAQIEGNSNPTVRVGNNIYTMYHTGNFTPRLTWNDSNGRISVDGGSNNAQVSYADSSWNANRINNRNITISQSAPSNPSTGDLWISW